MTVVHQDQWIDDPDGFGVSAPGGRFDGSLVEGILGSRSCAASHQMSGRCHRTHAGLAIESHSRSDPRVTDVTAHANQADDRSGGRPSCPGLAAATAASGPVTAHPLTSAIRTPFWDKLSDLRGRKPVFRIGIVAASGAATMGVVALRTSTGRSDLPRAASASTRGAGTGIAG